MLPKPMELALKAQHGGETADERSAALFSLSRCQLSSSKGNLCQYNAPHGIDEV
jgi:hypothetical protein